MASSFPKWMDQSFCERLLNNIDGTHLLSWEAEPLAVSGDNYSSILYRISLKSRTSVHAVVVKSLPQGSVMREYMLNDGIFSKEVDIYQKVLPAMHKLYTDQGGTRPYVCPLSYCAPIADIVVLQDLKPLGYTMANRQEQLDLDHSVLAIKTMAFYHGLSVGFNSLNPSDIQCYKENIYTTNKKESLKDYTNLIIMDLASEVETWQGFERFGSKLREYCETAFDTWIDLFDQVKGYFLVLVHGDFWTSNMLLRYSESGAIEDIKLIDFQYSKYGPAVLDILYFLYSSVREGVREKYRDHLLREYLAVLKETLSIVECAEQLPSLERLQNEMSNKMHVAAMVAFTILPAIVASQEEKVDYGTSADVNQPGSVQNPLKKSIRGSRFREVFPAVLIDLERNGIL